MENTDYENEMCCFCLKRETGLCKKRILKRYDGDGAEILKCEQYEKDEQAILNLPQGFEQPKDDRLTYLKKYKEV